MMNIHLIFNAHLDPVWLWPWQAGVDEAIATCRSACDRMDSHPDLVFTRGEAWVYWQIERTDPALFERIRAHVKTGAVADHQRLVDSARLQRAERVGFEKQIEIGRDYFQDRFGLFPRIGYNVDSFGHCATLPSLLRRYGQDRYVMMRPEDHETVFPPIFKWRGTPEEEPVTVYRIVNGYCAEEMSVERILGCTKGLPPGFDHAACFVGVGDHGGGPTEGLIAWCREHQNSIPGYTLRFSSLPDFFDAIDAYPGDLPEVTGELQQHAVGCYSVYRPIHVAVRRAEHILKQAECLRDAYPHALESPKKTAAELEDAWRQVCFAHFHDILGGTSIPSAYPIVLNQIGIAQARADEMLQIGLRRLYQTLPEDTQQRLVLLNASDQPYAGYVEHEPWLKFSGWEAGWGLVDERGRTVPYQLMNPEEIAFSPGKADPATLSHPRLLFPVRLGPNQLTTFRDRRNAASGSTQASRSSRRAASSGGVGGRLGRRAADPAGRADHHDRPDSDGRPDRYLVASAGLSRHLSRLSPGVHRAGRVGKHASGRRQRPADGIAHPAGTDRRQQADRRMARLCGPAVCGTAPASLLVGAAQSPQAERELPRASRRSPGWHSRTFSVSAKRRARDAAAGLDLGADGKWAAGHRGPGRLRAGRDALSGEADAAPKPADGES